MRLQWLELEAGRCVEIALGVVVPEEWTTSKSSSYVNFLKAAERESLHAELVATSAPLLVDLCKGLRDYQLAVLQGLEPTPALRVLAPCVCVRCVCAGIRTRAAPRRAAYFARQRRRHRGALAYLVWISSPPTSPVDPGERNAMHMHA